MTYTWTGNQVNASQTATEALLDPYSDWEKTNRFPASPRPNAVMPVLWQPVYVELAPAPGTSPSQAAIRLLDAGASRSTTDLRFHEDTFWRLRKIAGDPAATMADLPPGLRRFFIFRPEDVSNQTSGYPVTVLQLGPAIPATQAGKGPDTIDTWNKQQMTLPSGTVLTAVIDDQIGFANACFRATRTTTRIARLWLQGMPFQREGTDEVGRQVIGRELTNAEIDDLLSTNDVEDDIYRAVYAQGVPVYPPLANIQQRVRSTNLADPKHIRPFGFQAGHGTHVLDLAAGYPLEDAPTNRPIVAVQIPTLATAETSGARLDLFVLLGVVRVLHWADYNTGGPLPVVINISFGTSAGPKDGSGFLEAEVARLVSERNKTIPTVVVLPSGNGYRSHTHGSITVTKANAQSIIQRVQPEDLSVTFTELWPDHPADVTLTITPPVGPASPAFPLDHDGRYDWQRNGVPVGRIYVQRRADGRYRVTLALCPTLNHQDAPRTAPPGAYRLTLATTGSGQAVVAIDVQRDDTPSSFPQFGRQAYLEDDYAHELDPETYDFVMPHATKSLVARTGTFSAHATAENPSVVIVGGAFDRHAFSPAALYAASAETLKRKAPTLSAISEESRAHPGSLASGLFSGGVSLFSGTSMAAPRVARAIVDRLIAGTTYDVAALLGTAPTTPADHRLGAGTMPFTLQAGRPARRIRSA